jgi:hypothetical protein
MLIILIVVVIQLVEFNLLLLSANATGCPREGEVVLRV